MEVALTHQMPVDAPWWERLRCELLKIHDYTRWEWAQLVYTPRRRKEVEARKCLTCGHIQVRHF